MAASTSDVTLANSSWTQVSTNKSTVTITNPGTIPIFYAVAAATGDLALIVGHELCSRHSVTLSDLGTSGNNVFIRSGNTGGGATAVISAY